MAKDSQPPAARRDLDPIGRSRRPATAASVPSEPQAHKPPLRSPDADKDDEPEFEIDCLEEFEAAAQAREQNAKFIATHPFRDTSETLFRSAGRGLLDGVVGAMIGGAVRRDALPATSGARLMVTRDGATLKQTAWILLIEERLPEAKVIAASLLAGLVENELEDLLARPARPIVDALQHALAGRKKTWAVEMIGAWGSGKPATLGLHLAVLLGLRYGFEKDETIGNFVRTKFPIGYQRLLAQKAFSNCLDRVRELRNVVAHFDSAHPPREDHYHTLSRLTVGTPDFTRWFHRGPEPPEPPPSSAIYHHHLQLVPGAAPTPPPHGSPWQQLAAIVKRPSGIAVELDLQPATGTAATPPPTPLAPDQAIVLRLQLGTPGYPVLLSGDPAGCPIVLHPNRWLSYSRFPAGTHWLPPRGQSQYCYTVAVDRGTENVVAIVTREPLLAELSPPEATDYLRLTAAETGALIARLQQLPSDDWEIATCSVAVGAPT